MSISISSTTKQYPIHPYEKIKDKILGKRYNLSLVFIGKARAQKLNQQHRQRSYIPNVLSFPLDYQTGEIFICPQVAGSEAARHHFHHTADYVGFLFIHGCLHLKGYEHSDTMDKLEQKWCQHFRLR